MTPPTIPVALTIAGSDSSAGAGLQADLKTFSAIGVYAATAVTAVTAQNTKGVTEIFNLPPAIIAAQIEAVLCDFRVAAIKTGMLGTAEAVDTIAATLEKRAPGTPLILDPVLISTSGHRLLSVEGEKQLVLRLFPIASLVTPNLAEAAALLEQPVAQSEDEIRRQAEAMAGLGAKSVLIKGGHAKSATAADHFHDGKEHATFSTPRVETANTHGTGCTLASAITAYLVKGHPLKDAIALAKIYVQNALIHGRSCTLGRGQGPLQHFF